MVAAPRYRKRLRLIAVVFPLVALLVLELGLRAGGFEHELSAPPYRFLNPEADMAEWSGPMVQDPVLFWRLHAGYTDPRSGMRIPDTGFRTDFALQKAPGVRRILCAGDSSTFGMHVAEEHAWPARLAVRVRELTGAGTSVESLNLGVPGYTSFQGRRLLQTRGAAFQPDDIVVSFGAFNDWVPARGRTDAKQGDVPAWHALRTVQLAARLLGAVVPPDPSPSIDAFETMDTSQFAGPRRVPLADFEDNLRAIHATAEELGARLVFLAQPIPAATLRRNPIATDYADTVRRVGADLDVPVADGWAAFGASRFDGANLFIDFSHPTPQGHDLLATAAARALVAVD